MESRQIEKKLKQTLDEVIDIVPIDENVVREGCLATHSGYFHCDEALALAMLMLLPEFAKRPILRSRNQSLINQAHLVVDVGSVYDPNTLRFDHHQRGFNETLNEKKKTKLSSAGLIYKHYGHRILKELLSDQTHLTEADFDVLFRACYDEFIEHLDGLDNGIDPYDGNKRYKVSTTLSLRVGYLNPSWNDPDPYPAECFRDGMKLALTEFIACVERLTFEWLPARSLVEKAVTNRFEVHPSGSIIQLGGVGCPFRTHLSDLEDELGIPKILYVICVDRINAWNVICVNDRESEFLSRKPLPEAWRGLRGMDLSEKAGLPEDVIFTHASGFIGGAVSHKTCLEMAVRSLEN